MNRLEAMTSFLGLYAWGEFESAVAKFLWQSSLLSLGILALCLLAKCAPAKTRFRLWLVALLPFLLPIWLFPELGLMGDGGKIEVRSEPLGWVIDPARQLAQSATASQEFEGASPSGQNAGLIGLDSSDHQGSNLPIRQVWGLGSLLFALVFFYQLWGINGVIRRSKLASACWRGELLALAQGKRVPQLRVSSEVRAPFATGCLSPVIVIPESLAEAPNQATIQTILAHELSHIRRNDVSVRYLTALAQMVWWFHPAVWAVAKNLQWESELCVDEEMTEERGVNKMSYAKTLIEVAGRIVSRPWAALPLSPAAKELEKRILNLNRVRRRGWAWLPTLAGLMTVSLFSLSSVEGRDQEELSLGEFWKWMVLEAKRSQVEIPTIEAPGVSLGKGEIERVVFLDSPNGTPRVEVVNVDTAASANPKRPQTLIFPPEEVEVIDDEDMEGEEEVEVLEDEVEVREDEEEVREDEEVMEEDELDKSPKKQAEIRLDRIEKELRYRINGKQFKSLKAASAALGDFDVATILAPNDAGFSVTVGDVATLHAFLLSLDVEVYFGGTQVAPKRLEQLSQGLKGIAASDSKKPGEAPEVLFVLDQEHPWNDMLAIMMVCGSRKIMNPWLNLVVRRVDGAIARLPIYLPVDVGVR